MLPTNQGGTMNTKPKFFVSLLLAAVIVLVNFGSMPGTVYAAEGDEVIDITVTHEILCGEVTFTITLDDITLPYQLEIDYGDVIAPDILNFESYEVPPPLTHTYSGPGDYNLTITVTETGEGALTGTTSGVITIGPVVTLTSLPFPPLVVLGPLNDPANDTVVFKASVIGGTPPYTYAWDRDGVSEQVTVDTYVTFDEAPFIFTGKGKFQAQVSVTDSCGFTSTASLPVVVVDQGDICHPTAQKIADGVNTIFPAQAGDLYTCEEIYDFFNGGLTGDQLGFGRMWKAYNLALTMEELTWEDIRDWHLDTGGWGALLQLDRFSDLLEDHSIVDLMGLVMSEEYSLGDVRTAVRSTTRYEAADFEDVLSRIAEGATAGELSQLYKLAADLEVDPSAIDDYLTGGLTLAELKHMANFADRMEVDFTVILNIGIQDYRENLRIADKEEKNQQTATELAEQFSASANLGDVMNLLNGECEGNWGCVRKALREQEQEMLQAEGPSEKDIQTGEKLAEQFSADLEVVMDLFDEGECKGNWGCVRKALRDQEMTQAEGELSERDTKTALQIASKYDSTPEGVLDYHNEFCSGDWACTRAYYRELFMGPKKTGKPDK
jgi:hypothetical protein